MYVDFIHNYNLFLLISEESRGQYKKEIKLHSDTFRAGNLFDKCKVVIRLIPKKNDAYKKLTLLFAY